MKDAEKIAELLAQINNMKAHLLKDITITAEQSVLKQLKEHTDIVEKYKKTHPEYFI